jgi:hypothetical protein
MPCAGRAGRNSRQAGGEHRGAEPPVELPLVDRRAPRRRQEGQMLVPPNGRSLTRRRRHDGRCRGQARGRPARRPPPAGMRRGARGMGVARGCALERSAQLWSRTVAACPGPASPADWPGQPLAHRPPRLTRHHLKSPPPQWQRRTNIWRKVTSPAGGGRRLTKHRQRGAFLWRCQQAGSPLRGLSAAGLSIAGVRNLRPLAAMRSEPLDQRQLKLTKGEECVQS